MSKETAAARRKRHGEIVMAPAYTARQCPECKLWLYVNDGPWAEGGDRTKPIGDFLHYEAEHCTQEERDEPVLGIPYFHWNAEPVEAVRP